jgi:hypothetical protein
MLRDSTLNQPHGYLKNIFTKDTSGTSSQHNRCGQKIVFGSLWRLLAFQCCFLVEFVVCDNRAFPLWIENDVANGNRLIKSKDQ